MSRRQGQFGRRWLLVTVGLLIVGFVAAHGCLRISPTDSQPVVTSSVSTATTSTATP